MNNIYKVIWGDSEETGHKKKEHYYIRTNAENTDDILSAYDHGKRIVDADMESPRNEDYPQDCWLSVDEVNRIKQHYPSEDFEKYLGDWSDEDEQLRCVQWENFYYVWKIITQIGNPPLLIEETCSQFPELPLDGIYVSETASGAGDFHIEFRPRSVLPPITANTAAEAYPVIQVIFGSPESENFQDYSVFIRSNDSVSGVKAAFENGA